MNFNKIALDFGHGFGDPGAVNGKWREDLLVREIGERVKSYLESNGKNVKIVSIDGGLKSRAVAANNWGADLYISIHLNSASSKQANGTEIYTYNSTTKAIEPGKRILANICKLGYNNRGMKTANFAVLKHTSMPAMLIECCFISNDSEMNKFNADNFAKAIAEGILNKSISNPAKPQTPPQNTGKVYRIYHDGVQQGTAYSNIDNIQKIVKDGLTKGSNKIEIVLK